MKLLRFQKHFFQKLLNQYKTCCNYLNAFLIVVPNMVTKFKHFSFLKIVVTFSWDLSSDYDSRVVSVD